MLQLLALHRPVSVRRVVLRASSMDSCRRDEASCRRDEVFQGLAFSLEAYEPA